MAQLQALKEQLLHMARHLPSGEATDAYRRCPGLPPLVPEQEAALILQLAQAYDATPEADRDRRLTLTRQLRAAADARAYELAQRCQALYGEHPEFPWPVEAVVLGMGLAAAAEGTPVLRRERYEMRGCGCVFEAIEADFNRLRQIARCDRHEREPSPPAAPLPCAAWQGPAGDCAVCGVSAFDHPGAPTPESRGCRAFRWSPIRVDFGDRTRCDFCCLPRRDHRPPPFPPALLAACEQARLYLGSLDDLGLSDARTASELRHRLRTPGEVVLREAVGFLGGLQPARRGQRALVRVLMGYLAPEHDRGDHRAVLARRAAARQGSGAESR